MTSAGNKLNDEPQNPKQDNIKRRRQNNILRNKHSNQRSSLISQEVLIHCVPPKGVRLIITLFITRLIALRNNRNII